MKPFVLALCISVLVLALACFADGIRPHPGHHRHDARWARERHASGNRRHRNNRKSQDHPKWKESERHEERAKKDENGREDSRGSGGWFTRW